MHLFEGVSMAALWSGCLQTVIRLCALISALLLVVVPCLIPLNSKGLNIREVSHLAVFLCTSAVKDKRHGNNVSCIVFIQVVGAVAGKLKTGVIRPFYLSCELVAIGAVKTTSLFLKTLS